MCALLFELTEFKIATDKHMMFRMRKYDPNMWTGRDIWKFQTDNCYLPATDIQRAAGSHGRSFEEEDNDNNEECGVEENVEYDGWALGI